MGVVAVVFLALLAACLPLLVGTVPAWIYLDYARAWAEWERHEAERFRHWKEGDGS